MKTNPKAILTGTHTLSGNEACIEGAFAAGCRFLAAYPIMPALETIDRYLQRSSEVDATFIQMEDEISALAAVIGASWTGKKSMTITSGAGFSNMMEHLGLAVMLETPCVIIDIQRAGPSIGIPNHPGQGDIMQARWGSHGDYELIVLYPSSPQEMFDFTIKAFNLSEKYRTPVLVLSDEYVAHQKDKVKIQPADKIKIEPRRYFKGEKDKYLPFKRDKNFVPRMVDIGENYRFHVTGLTHDDRGYPVMNEKCQEYNVHPILWKIMNDKDKIVEFQETGTDDAEIVIISYGATSNAAQKAMKQAREMGIKVGSLKLDTVWPFPDQKITKLAEKVKTLIVPEINYGQIVLEVERCSYGLANVVFVSHGETEIDNADNLISIIKQSQKEKQVKKGIIEYRNEARRG